MSNKPEKCPHHVRRNHACPICARITAAIIADLFAGGNELEEMAEVRVRRDSIPKGGKLVEAYLTETEVIVMGYAPDDDEHNCDAMGCGTLSHVLYRLPLPTVEKRESDEQGI